MLSGTALRKTGGHWKFASEKALEDFVWANLTNLFDLIPLERQYCCNGDFCDILAIDGARQLVIQELKNEEDRYLVQQLTRYYDNLIEVKPLPNSIDYMKPIKLVAIAPSYHRHNFVDLKYHKLDIQFLKFEVIEEQSKFYLSLRDVDMDWATRIQIPFTQVELVSYEEIPDPLDFLLDWLGTCTKEEQEAILKMRERLLLSDPKMKEIGESKNTLKYGQGKSKPCAEISWYRKLQKPIVFLWLPITFRKKARPPLGRMRLWLDGKNVEYVGHVPNGLGQMKTSSEWEKTPRSEWPRKKKFNWGGSDYRSQTPLKTLTYLKYIYHKEGSNLLEFLVNLALERWRQR